MTGREQTLKNVEMFLAGYEQYYSVSVCEKESILAFIAIRHFDIQATIIETLGLNCVDFEFLDTQLKWLEMWVKLCFPCAK